MKQNKLSLLALIMLFSSLAIFMSCSNEGTEQIIELKNPHGTGFVNPVEFGKLHNKYLLQALKYSSKSSKVGKSNLTILAVKESFMSVDMPFITDAEQSYIFDNYSNMSVDQMKMLTFESLISTQSKEYYNDIDFALDNSIDYPHLSNELDILAEKINNNLVGQEWDIVMVYLETIRYSAYFWYPTDLGGSGLGYPYTGLGNEYNVSQQGKSSATARRLPGWVRADGTGAGLGMSAWALTGLFVAGPTGGVAGFLYGGISGAITSSMTAHKTW